MHKILAVSLLFAACVSSAFAWGQDGHRIVCRIAYDELSLADKKEANRLAKGYKMPPDAQLKVNAFPDVCVFPDEARSKAVAAQKNNQTDSPWLQYIPFNNWHFINVTRDTTTIPESECKNDCVLTGIATHSTMLQTGADDQARGEGLIFLGHWLGDIHQPLHVSFADDQGGNKVQPITGDYYPVPKDYPLNLHSVWDSGIIGKADKAPGWKVYADRLRQKITTAQRKQWLAGDPLAWAQESYEITTKADVEYCKEDSSGCESFGNGRTLTRAYQHEFQSTVERRLQMAGVRLAKLIHDDLHATH
jgi:hypothetical protein